MSDVPPPPPPPPPPPYGQPPYGQPQYGQYGAVAGSPPNNFLVPAILVTIFCCLPAGIAAIVYAAQVNSKWSAGDAAGAHTAAKNARTWTFVSLGVGVVVIFGYIVLGVIAGIADSTTSDF